MNRAGTGQGQGQGHVRMDSRQSGRIPYKSTPVLRPSSTSIPSDLIMALILSKAFLSLALFVAKHWLIQQNVSIITINSILLLASAVGWRVWAANQDVSRFTPKERQNPAYSLLYGAEVILYLLTLSNLSVTKTVLLTSFSSLWTGGFPIPSAGGKKESVASNNALFTTIGLISSAFLLDRLLNASSVSLIGYIYLLLHLLISGSRLEILSRQPGDNASKGRFHANGTGGAAIVGGSVWLLKYLIESSRQPYIPESAAAMAVAPSISLLPLPSLGLLIPFALLLGSTLLIIDPLLSRVLSDNYPTSTQFQTGWLVATGGTVFVGFVGFGEKAGLGELAVGGLAWAVINHLISVDPRATVAVAPSSFVSPASVLSRSSTFYRHLRTTIKTIMATQDSRRIYFFLCLNLAYMVVQMVYGIWTNSLGLISDSIHMFFDCLALGMGLFASVMANWSRNEKFTYGYSRVETLSGFANGLFLLLISMFIIFEAIQRLLDPPEMNTSQLLVVSSVGLAVNLVGMYATGGHHHHGHGHSHDHGPPKPKAVDHSSHDHSSHDHSSHDHSSHDHSSHDHSSHAGHDHGDHDDHDEHEGHAHAHSHNMTGVFLHVMADTLGSVGVILSTILINSFGWTGFDPLASIFIAALIFASVVPLVIDSGRLLVLDLGVERAGEVRKALDALTNIEGVASYSRARFWEKDPATMIGSIHIKLSSSSSPSSSSVESSSYVNLDKVRERVRKVLLKEIGGLKELCIQFNR